MQNLLISYTCGSGTDGIVSLLDCTFGDKLGKAVGNNVGFDSDCVAPGTLTTAILFCEVADGTADDKGHAAIVFTVTGATSEMSVVGVDVVSKVP